MAGRVRAVFRDVGSVVGEGVRAAQRFAERDVRCVWDTFVELDTSTRACLGPPNRVKNMCGDHAHKANNYRRDTDDER